MTAIEKPAQNLTLAPVEFNREQLDLIKTQIAPGASDGELQLFIEQCKRTGLDPFSRQIYAVMREENKNVNGQWIKTQKMAIQVAIDGFRVIAERHGQYAGRVGPLWCGPDGKWLDVWLSKDTPAAAKVGILRHGFKEPLWAVARFDAYASRKKDGGLMGLWGKMPDVMIAKCAEAQALRAAFPNDLSGLYATEEMQQAGGTPEGSHTNDDERLVRWRDRARKLNTALAQKFPDVDTFDLFHVEYVGWENDWEAARAIALRLEDIGKQKSLEAASQPAETAAEAAFTPDAESITDQQRGALMAHLKRGGLPDDSETRSRFYSWMVNTIPAGTGTKELAREDATGLLEMLSSMDTDALTQTVGEFLKANSA